MARRTSFVAVAAALVSAACASTGGAESQAVGCSRDTLADALSRAAIIMMGAEDPRPGLLAAHVRFTEDGVDIEPGQGIWAEGAIGAGVPFMVVDSRECVAVSLEKVSVGGSPALVAMRVKLEEGGVSEVETMAVRNQTEGMIFNPDAIATPSHAMTLVPPPGALDTREEMIEIAQRYPEGLRVGSFVASDVPFAPEAYRFENGQLMAGPGCTFLPGCDDIKNQRLPTLADIEHYVVAVDEELGVVVLRMDFGPGSVFPSPDRPEGMTLSVFEAFKIWGGQVHAVEAFMEAKPGDAPLGWEPAAG